MISRRALTGLSLLCALAFCAFAAPSAFGATTGTTAFTCKPGGTTDDFGDAHCDTTKAKGGFGHVLIPPGVKTAIEGTNAGTKNETKESTAPVLTSTIGGLEGEITCTGVTSGGELENLLEGEVHKIKITGITLTYTGCTAPKPAGQNCKVFEDIEATKTEGTEKTIKTVSLTAETITVGATHKWHFVPTTGTKFATFFLKGCTTAGLNKTYEVTGTVDGEGAVEMPALEEPLEGEVKGTPRGTGATLKVNLPKNAESTLLLSGQKAGLTQLETIRMKGGENPIGTTAPPFKTGT